ncbi:gliding motility-associated C-terminal domain-containing protein [Filimonas lacunae]|uniref:Gliding motility-associated C-terminal domain-containing protein n=1 Tax=Filimonas lacunae TaxID=477680 RepID=A0A173MFC9_9BACT|nr:gliding motility-associated C-terminal domain-containing protein [Filimonas lacunae]BAV06199.1 CHU large protein [Filimonas lacunae]SIT25234.1 gliding motility-associated C-terminal domain-containing protein [Filimonas lacunae]
MTKPLLLLLIAITIALHSHAQIENNNWYFGNGTDGIIFTSTGPQKVSNKYPGVGFEGMVVVNDPVTGALKFYSDGRSAINRNHQVMPNGSNLSGHWSGAQCVQSCPVPGTCAKKFYLFTNSAWDRTAGALSYSIIDFTTNALGEITNLNTPLWSGLTDQAMTLVNKTGSSDYWLILNEYQLNNYYVWPITAAGIGTPQKYTFTTTGYTYQMNYTRSNGKLVVTGEGNRALTILDFNATTGVLSNEQVLGASIGNFAATRFSPDGTKLYAGTLTGNTLYQYDFNTGQFTDMHTCCYSHDLKIGPDGKMYFIRSYNDPQPISVIDFPDRTAVGNACNYHQITFPTNFNGEVRRFPEILTLPVPPVALEDNTTFTGTTVDVDVLHNDYDTQGDAISLDAIVQAPKYGTATIVNNQIRYTYPGGCNQRDSLIYRITDSNCEADTAYLVLTLPRTPILTTVDAAICPGSNYYGHTTAGTYTDNFVTATGCDSIRTLNLSLYTLAVTDITDNICEGGSYAGHTTSGTYTDVYKDIHGCDSTRTLHLTVLLKSYATQNVIICEGQNYWGHTVSGTYAHTLRAANGCDSMVTLNLTVNPRTYSTLTATICEGENYLGYTQTGTYQDVFTNSQSCDSIRTIRLTVLPKDRTTLLKSICYYETFEGYNTSGVYRDTFKNSNNCDSIRTLVLSVEPRAVPLLGPDTTLCTGSSATLYPGSFKSYLWQNGSTDSTLTITKGGLYTVTVANNCGTESASRLVLETECNIYFPSAFTPNKDGRNDEFKILTLFPVTAYHLALFNRWGQQVFESTNPKKGWDGTFHNLMADPGTYVWMCAYVKEGVSYSQKGTVVLIR